MQRCERHAKRLNLSQQGAYWRKQLDTLSVLDVHVDYPRPPAQSFLKGTASLRFETQLSLKLRQFCLHEGVVLSTLLLAALKVVLCRYTGQEDVHIGGVSCDSIREKENGQPEVFTNLLVLRTVLTGDLSVRRALQRVARTVAEAAHHRDYPFVQLVKEIGGEADFSRAAIFQYMFVPCDIPYGLSEVPLTEESLTGVADDMARNDMVLIASEEEEYINLRCEYDTDLFDSRTIQRFLGHCETVLAGMVTDPEQQLTALAWLTQSERQQVLIDWNATQAEYPLHTCLPGLFDGQVEHTPDAVAVVYEDQRLTYAELNTRANQLAHYLQTLGVGPSVLVGLCVERSLEMIVGLLGILKAGGAYVPLDPAYPQDRLAFMLSDAQASVLLTQHHLQHLIAQLPRHNANVVCLDTDWSRIAQENATRPTQLSCRATPEDLAYVIYTSGSTGKPKGVQISHRAVVNCLHSMRAQPGLTARDTLLAVTTLSFDIAALEIFLPLTVGARVVIANQTAVADGTQLAALLITSQVTVMQATPATWRLLLAAGWEGNEQLRIWCGGEALSSDLAEQLLERSQGLWNLYGPTEATIWSTVYQVTDGRNPIPIGRPIANTQVYILDPQRQPVPVGVPGELYLGGDGLARGYLKRPELTAEKFIHNPFRPESVSRLYKTGDRVRSLPDGNIEFLGRLDHQIKLRGFRIELGEIEVVLRQHPDVREAAVLAREDTPGDTRVVAYLVLHQDQPALTEELRYFLHKQLPAYMIPAAFVQLHAMPLTPNGKVDRRALPVPKGLRPPVVGEAVPQTEAEQRVAAVWQAVLQVENVGLHDNFFDLGGHSLLLAQVRAKLQDVFSKQLSPTDMFQYPTVRTLATYLSQESQQSALPPSERHVDAGSAQQTSSCNTDIAIIGMAGRFPGAADIDAFWNNLRDGVESISFFSDEELLAAGLDPTLLDNPSYVKAGAILPDIDLFDADFFGFTPREAELLDPQQRVFLETAWEALEKAGYASSTSALPMGVYAGVGMNMYALHNRSVASHHVGTTEAFQLMISNEKDFLPTRVSYKLNLTGPSINVQTACSTSLVAVHLACQSVLNGECEMALAGGVSISPSQWGGYVYQEGMVLSPDGHCRAFDAKGQGTIFGSGVGVVILKRLSDAIADRDCVHAVIKGSATNNDGSLKIGYTAPHVDGQAAVIAQAQATAGVKAESITYVETHGTATALGDPIEIAALTQAFLPSTQKKGFCAIGSVKTNIGHLDTAAGVTGLIKTVLALKHKVVPPSLHYQEPNPHIDFADSPFYVNDTLADWLTHGTPRRAGVSAFGIGGTNCHLIVEEAPEGVRAADQSDRIVAKAPEGVRARDRSDRSDRPHHLLTLSAKNATALRQLVGRYQNYLETHPAISLADICYTANTGRTHCDYRLAVVADSAVHMAEQLAAFVAQGETSESLLHGQLVSNSRPKVAFLFSGQGSQYPEMGRQLYETQATFRAALDRCDELLRPHLTQSVLSVLYPEPNVTTSSDETYTQATLFAVEYALAMLWQSWGIEPAVVLGHSGGEYVAACVAGVFGLEDGLKLVVERGRLIRSLTQAGEMAVVFADEARVAAAVKPYADKVSIAVLNGPENIVISGDCVAVQKVLATLELQDIQVLQLPISYASHSPLMEPILDAFEQTATTVTYASPRIAMVSSMTGRSVEETSLGNTAYWPRHWRRHLREPVRFAAGMAALHEQGCNLFIEMSPHPALFRTGQQCLPEGRGTWLPSLSKHVGDWQHILQSVAAAYVSGAPVDWEGLDRESIRYRLDLPTYPFQRQRYWISSVPTAVRPIQPIPPIPTPTDETSQVQIAEREGVLPADKKDGAVGCRKYFRPAFSIPFVAARTPIEMQLAAIWTAILGIEPIGVDDNFFSDLRGTSLVATQLTARVRDVFKIPFPLRAIFERSTIAGIAELVRQEVAQVQNNELDNEFDQMLLEVEELSIEETRTQLGGASHE